MRDINTEALSLYYEKVSMIRNYLVLTENIYPRQ